MFCISLSVRISPPRPVSQLGRCGHLQHKAYQLFILSVAIYQRNERHNQFSLLAGYSDSFPYLGHLWQGGVCNSMITLHIGIAHGNKLWILYCNGISGISITCTNMLLVGKDWQQRVNPDLWGGQVEKLLCTRRQTYQQ